MRGIKVLKINKTKLKILYNNFEPLNIHGSLSLIEEINKKRDGGGRRGEKILFLARPK